MNGRKALQLAVSLLLLAPLAPGLASETGKEVNAEIKLPLPDMQPVRMLDSDVRVALSFPEGLASRDLSVYTKRSIVVEPLMISISSEGTDIARSRPAHLDSSTLTIHIRLAWAFKRILPGVVRGLFPQTKLFHTEEVPPPHEVLANAEIRPWFLENQKDHIVYGLKILVLVALVDAEGKPIDTVEGLGEAKGNWASKARCESLSTKAFKAAIEQLVQRFKESERLRLHLRKLAEARALPATLVTTVRFDDRMALLPNGRLDAGEEARLVVQVTNSGSGPAYAVAVHVNSDRPQVSISGEGTVGDLDPGGKKEVALRVAGRLDLKTEIAKLRVDTEEKRGYEAQPVLLELPTGQLVPPKLEIADITLNDRTGRAKGDGDGQPGNGETIEAVVRVRNAGSGEAADVVVTMASPKGAAEVLEPKIILPRIAVNGVGEARLLFRIPINVQGPELSLAFQAVDGRGSEVGSSTKEQTWKLRMKRPGIELSYRLYDGGSAGSAGNRDGKVNNGERIEVAVTPTNRGDLLARAVRIVVMSDDPKLAPRPAVLEVGDLPAQVEGATQRFVFDVPRGYGLDRPEGDLHFALTVSQQDFAPRKEPVSLGFHALRPDLSMEAAAPASLVRGSGGEVGLRLRNAGSLRAEEVTLEAASDAPGVDLLDERGVPVRSLKIAVGSLDPGSVAPPSSLRINVRRNAGVGPAAVRITLSQKDFPALSRTVQVPVTEEAASVIAAPRPEEPAPRSPSVPVVPATISFLQNTPGQHLTAEAVVLRFEVQSATELGEVRLTQNERLVPLEVARRTASAAGGLQAVQYELPVQLAEGENRFEVVAVTRQGLRSARSLALIRDREVGRLWVVAIGISKYQDPSIHSLGFADADARSVHGYFRDTFGLPESQIFLRTNEQATLREIKSILGTQLVARANDPRDTVVLYFAGHGMRDRVIGSLDPDGLSKYFLPYDTNRTDLYSTALDMDEVTNILRRLVPERVVFLLDSCFSGAAGGRSPFDPKAEGERALISGEFLDRMAHVGKGRVVLTASGPDESAQESADFGHGVFTYYLLEGLSGAADLNGDGDIDVHEVYGYVSEKVGRATRGRQNPKLKEPDLVGQILIGRGAVHRRR